MITIRGKWFDGRTSKHIDAVLKVCNSGYCLLTTHEGTPIIERQHFDAEVSPRLGDTVRRLRFGEQGVLETSDNSGVDDVLALVHSGYGTALIHRLESRLFYVIIAIVITLLLGLVGVKFGVPAAAKFIATRLPVTVFDRAGEQAINILDHALFNPSQLEPGQRERVRRRMQHLISLHPELRLRVDFRQGGRAGPNAFALPDGQIIFTDEMVLLAEHDNELLGVFAHEAGHVAHRHAMRRIIQDSLLTFAALALTGDASGVSELFLGLPVILTELAYSREFEEEADSFALEYMRSHKIATHYFRDILLRIDRSEQSEKVEDNWLNFLSTHPDTRKRVRAFADDK